MLAQMAEASTLSTHFLGTAGMYCCSRSGFSSGFMGSPSGPRGAGFNDSKLLTPKSTHLCTLCLGLASSSNRIECAQLRLDCCEREPLLALRCTISCWKTSCENASRCSTCASGRAPTPKHGDLGRAVRGMGPPLPPALETVLGKVTPILEFNTFGSFLRASAKTSSYGPTPLLCLQLPSASAHVVGCTEPDDEPRGPGSTCLD
mmetsp:Transcript_62872/g.164887  ORF Transcript_62872/g.164887 Transcript_62872/m.164887 type:complete len:204 (-) Transcript_62872:343-954(-)